MVKATNLLKTVLFLELCLFETIAPSGKQAALFL
jgi:hypothetical protein